MEWIFKMIEPVIKDCQTPEEAETAVIKWGLSQEPRDAAIGLLAIKMINSEYTKVNSQSPDTIKR